MIWFKTKREDNRPVWGRPLVMWYIPHIILKKMKIKKQE